MATVNCIEYANSIVRPVVMNEPNTSGRLIRKRFSFTVGAVVAAGTVIVLGILPGNARFYGGAWSNDALFSSGACLVAIGVTGTPAKFHAGINTSGAQDETAFGNTVALGGSGTYVPTADILVIATTADIAMVAGGAAWGWFDYVIA